MGITQGGFVPVRKPLFAILAATPALIVLWAPFLRHGYNCWWYEGLARIDTPAKVIRMSPRPAPPLVSWGEGGPCEIAYCKRKLDLDDV